MKVQERSSKKKDSLEYLPTLAECMSSPSCARNVPKPNEICPSDDIFDAPSGDIVAKRNKRKQRILGKNPSIERRRPENRASKVNKLDEIPIGTPVLAKWRLEYYPAMILDYNEMSKRYTVKYCDDLIRKLARERIAVPGDGNFLSAPLAPIEIIRGASTETKNSCSQSDLELLEGIVDGNFELIKGLITGTIKNQRRDQFFKSQKDRSRLHHKIRPGHLTYSQYYLLSEMLQNRIPKYQMELNMSTMDGLLFRQLMSMVVLPELILADIKRVYPYCEAEQKLDEFSIDRTKDFVDYVLGCRDLHKWGRLKINNPN